MKCKWENEKSVKIFVRFSRIRMFRVGGTKVLFRYRFSAKFNHKILINANLMKFGSTENVKPYKIIII